MRKAGITATGSFFPEKIITNHDLEKRIDTNDEWIRSRTGISQRHYAEKGVGSADLAAPAVKKMLEDRGISPEEIDLVIFATVTPDTVFPASACRIQNMLGMKNAWGFDVSAACSSFLFTLTTGIQYVQSGRSNKCVVIGADVMTSIVNHEERATCVIFGDGAGCVLIEPVEEGGFIDDFFKVDGSGAEFLHMPAGGSRLPASLETVKNGDHFIHQQGNQVFKRAVKDMAQAAVNVMEKNNIKPEEITLFVPHQANKRIIDVVGHRAGFKPEQVIINIDKRGNTTSATLPTCLDEAAKEGRIKKGDLVMLAAFGAGFTWGASLFQWNY